MDERLRFVAKLLEGETMTDACREFGISRKTGYKIFNRYKESGFESLSAHVRGPRVHARGSMHDRDVVVTACGRICLHRKRVNLSHVFAGQRGGIKESDEGIWIVSFMHYDLGFIATGGQPVRHLGVTYVLGTTCHLCVQVVPAEWGGESGI